MVFLVHAFQPVERQVRIYLRGRNIGMAKDRLHRAQVRAIFDHVRGTAMTQHVRAGVAAHA